VAAPGGRVLRGGKNRWQNENSKFKKKNIDFYDHQNLNY
jgi:hypothetical protein